MIPNKFVRFFPFVEFGSYPGRIRRKPGKSGQISDASSYLAQDQQGYNPDMLFDTA